MSYDLIKANLNLYAVLKNLEDLIEYDPEMKQLAKDWDVSIQFSVSGGPNAYIEFKNGVCTVGNGKYKKPSVKLYFTSPDHLNKMMDGDGNPIPLKGFTKLGFLTKDFPKVTDKLEYYLKPTDELLKDKQYLELNTRMTLNTAAFAVREIGSLDPIVKNVASHIQDGGIVLTVLPDGPTVSITIKDGEMIPAKSGVDKPMAKLTFKNIKVANDFLNGKSDTFTEVANGNVALKGQTGMVDALSLVLDRIPHYLG